MSLTSSAVTYTSVYTDSEPGRVFWGADEELSYGGSPWVIVYGYDGLPMMPVAPPSPDYIPGPEEPHTPPAPQDEDEHELMFIQPHDPDFEQPLPPIVSPTAESPKYVAESDPEEDPEEYEEDETEDGLVVFPMDGGDDGDDDDIDSSGYDDDDEDEDEEEKEKEHLATPDSAIVIPIDELASPPEGTEPIIPPPSTDTATTGARVTIRPQTSISLSPEAEVERLLAMPTLPPSPLTSLSPPSTGERLARCTAPATLPSPPLPPSLYPPPVDRRDGIPESEQQPRKRLCLSTLGSRYEVGESSTRGRGVDYGFVDTVEVEMRHRGIGEVGYRVRDTWIDLAESVPEMEPMTLEKVNTRVTELAEFHEHDTQDLYALLEDAQDVWIVEKEAYAAREAWAHSVGLSQTVHHELQTLREQVYAQEYQLQTHQTQLHLQSTLIQTQQQLHETHSQIQQAEMAGLRETDHAELLALRRQSRRAGQSGGDVRVPNQQDAPRDADRQNPPPPNTDTPPHHMTSKSVQAMIDQALLRNSTNEDESQSSHKDNPRHVQTTRRCFYANFMKCHPLNFKRNEGVVGLTRWIEKMESVFNINGCAIENQMKFATCTLLDAALTWWNSQIRTLGPEAYAMTWEVLKKKMTDKYCLQRELKKLEIEL
nr:hypothetical protein [Tanacetum cinerariifolium]